uniref:TLC domain-containing protein n=1 Tax=Chromera velia CCMP2878 TaxID=1169474 RepID=A0A0G4IE32_9ALVE|mmetsp:Transcript_24171/g.47526  ORF Transcript_24171/g.47526 Transcript_24171/m.47526 type:complete len:393 (-) Transcript_24171:963-2141(-)|eukprot:Cvel_13624.t1-p1 / transcript=Cvel_13624.t1 / gene=Cvel_13624 / organism=Chromera_velia_CCMP2878 / gene_product=hypothetical protein / transcript_product=hypothetical protein / location=Cvel_scaffold938:56171-57621(-) / protein_length=392 / sequence_SO=supercontig / SO=protein_coding / is_pseudo=false
MNLFESQIDVSLTSQVSFLLALSLYWSVVVELGKRVFERWLVRRDFWERAKVPQMQMMANFGYKQPIDDRSVVSAFSFVCVLAVHHLFCGSMMLPVAVFGWSGSGVFIRNLFILGALNNLAFDIYDFIFTTLRAWGGALREAFGLSPVPVIPWIVVHVLHPSLSLLLCAPMCAFYVELRQFHVAACSLILAGGVSFLIGQFKFTLDVSQPNSLLLYKSLILFQLGLLLYTRVYIWFPVYFETVEFFKNDDGPYAHEFYKAGAVLGGTLSVFNVLTVLDCLNAAAKWLPKTLPKTRAEKREMALEVVRQGSLDFGGASPSLLYIAEETPRMIVKSLVKSRSLLHFSDNDHLMSSLDSPTPTSPAQDATTRSLPGTGRKRVEARPLGQLRRRIT